MEHVSEILAEMDGYQEQDSPLIAKRTPQEVWDKRPEGYKRHRAAYVRNHGGRMDPATGNGYYPVIYLFDEKLGYTRPVLLPSVWRVQAIRERAEQRPERPDDARSYCRRKGIPWEQPDHKFRSWEARWIAGQRDEIWGKKDD